VLSGIFLNISSLWFASGSIVVLYQYELSCNLTDKMKTDLQNQLQADLKKNGFSTDDVPFSSTNNGLNHSLFHTKEATGSTLDAILYAFKPKS